jgi:hypothetical protein
MFQLRMPFGSQLIVRNKETGYRFMFTSNNIFADMDENADIFYDIFDDDMELVNLVADVRVIADIQAVQQHNDVLQECLPRNTIW